MLIKNVLGASAGTVFFQPCSKSVRIMASNSRMDKPIANAHSCTTANARRRDIPASAKDRKSTRLNSSHVAISYAVFCLKKKKIHPSNETEKTDTHKNDDHRLRGTAGQT